VSYSLCFRCQVDLDESYGIVIQFAVVAENGEHRLHLGEEPSMVLCEKCWEEIQIIGKSHRINAGNGNYLDYFK
jgi:hypothetical protein